MHLHFQEIKTAQKLQELCDRIFQQGWVAVDTEFIRTQTYHAKLALLQVAVDKKNYLIDPLLPLDLTDFWACLANPQIVTVCHAAGEDLELFYQYHPQAPARLFDTQTAWAFLHGGQQVGYANLIANILDIELDKSQTRTNWLQRPLNSEQRQYAIADVHYLAQIYPILKQQIEASTYATWFKQECTFAIEKRRRQATPEYAWYDLGVYQQLKGVQRPVAAALARWRLHKAQQQDIALPFILKDAQLLKLSIEQPKTLEALYDKLDAPMKRKEKYGQEILDTLEAGLHQPQEAWPREIPRLDDHPSYKAWMKQAKQIVQTTAKQYALATTLLASKKQLNELFIWHLHTEDSMKQQRHQPDLLLSWRYELVGQQLWDTLLSIVHELPTMNESQEG